MHIRVGAAVPAVLGAVRDGGGFVSTVPPRTPPTERDIHVAGVEVAF
jgi:hypothetical protein